MFVVFVDFQCFFWAVIFKVFVFSVPWFYIDFDSIDVVFTQNVTGAARFCAAFGSEGRSGAPSIWSQSGCGMGRFG